MQPLCHRIFMHLACSFRPYSQIDWQPLHSLRHYRHGRSSTSVEFSTSFVDFFTNPSVSRATGWFSCCLVCKRPKVLQSPSTDQRFMSESATSFASQTQVLFQVRHFCLPTTTRSPVLVVLPRGHVSRVLFLPPPWMTSPNPRLRLCR